jgi:hypothetical protein
LALLCFVGIYSLAVLSTVDDGTMVLNKSITVIPLINAQVSSLVFGWLMPVIVLAAHQYFHAHLRAVTVKMRETNAGLVVRTENESESIFCDLVMLQLRRHGNHFVPNLVGRLLSVLIVWLLAPASVLFAWLRYLPSHHSLVSYTQLAVLMIAIVHPAVWHLRLRHKRRSVHLLVGASILWVLLATATTYVLNSATPAICFNPGLHDKNHPFFTYVKVRPECASRANVPSMWLASAWRTLGLPVGPNLMGMALAAKDESKPVNAVVSLKLDLGNSRAAGVNLEKAYLMDIDLTGASLPQSNFSNANLKFAKLMMTDFREATLFKASFIRSNGQFIDYANANLVGSYFRAATLNRVSFESANLTGASFYCATLIGADFRSSDLTKTEMINTRFVGGRFDGAKGLTLAQLDTACGTGNDFGSTGLKIGACSKEWKESCRQDVE